MHLLPPSVRRALAAFVLVPAMTLGACTSDDGATSPGDVTSGSSADVGTAETKDRRLRLDHRVTRVAGELPPRQRKRLERKLGPVVRSYLEPGFLRDYPMQGPGAAFARFTPGARQLARKNQRLLTGTGLGRVDDVRAKRASAYYSVVAPSGRAVGVTARLVVDLRATRDERTRTVRYRGRLLLTPTEAGWRIFGYDLSRSGADAMEDRKTSGRKSKGEGPDSKGREGEAGGSGAGKGKR